MLHLYLSSDQDIKSLLPETGPESKLNKSEIKAYYKIQRFEKATIRALI